MQAASQLCSSMGRSFSSKDNNSNVSHQFRCDKQNARVLKFDKCIRGALYQFAKEVSEQHSVKVDAALLTADVFVSLREMNAEPSTGGDPYMKVVRRTPIDCYSPLDIRQVVAVGLLSCFSPVRWQQIKSRPSLNALCSFRPLSHANRRNIVQICTGFLSGFIRTFVRHCTISSRFGPRPFCRFFSLKIVRRAYHMLRCHHNGFASCFE